MTARKDHLRGQAHGSFERHRPDRSLVVPADQIHPFQPPRLTKQEASRLGLLTIRDVADKFAWTMSRARSWADLGRFEVVAFVAGSRAFREPQVRWAMSHDWSRACQP